MPAAPSVLLSRCPVAPPLIFARFLDFSLPSSCASEMEAFHNSRGRLISSVLALKAVLSLSVNSLDPCPSIDSPDSREFWNLGTPVFVVNCRAGQNSGSMEGQLPPTMTFHLVLTSRTLGRNSPPLTKPQCPLLCTQLAVHCFLLPSLHRALFPCHPTTPSLLSPRLAPFPITPPTLVNIASVPQLQPAKPPRSLLLRANC